MAIGLKDKREKVEKLLEPISTIAGGLRSNPAYLLLFGVYALPVIALGIAATVGDLRWLIVCGLWSFGTLPLVIYFITHLEVPDRIRASLGPDPDDVLDDSTNKLIIVAQNMHTLLSNEKTFLDRVAVRLRNDPEFEATIILTVPDFFRVIGCSTLDPEVALGHFRESVECLRACRDSLSTHQQKRFKVRFHPGASSLSAIIRYTRERNNARALFVAKWATDVEMSTRLHCYINESIHRTLFRRLTSHIDVMQDPAMSKGLEDIGHEN